MISTVEGSEQRAGEVFELLIGVIHQLLFGLLEFREVDEWDRVIIDTNICDQLTHVTVRSIVDVLEDTVLLSGVVLHEGVGSNLLLNFLADDVLVPQHVSDLVLIDLHAFLIRPLHGASGMAIVVLQVEVFFFRKLGKFLLCLVVADGVQELLAAGAFVLNLMNEGVHFVGSETR